MNNYQEQYAIYLSLFEDKLMAFLEQLKINCQPNLYEAMQYSLLAGGKRVRPILMLAVADALNLSVEEVLPYSVALECIHTYSLIHDDLPCMDNDNYRRGKLTNHKVFGEAVALLAGDALLNYAYEIIFSFCMTKNNINNINNIKAGSLLAYYAGSCGMIAGQTKDIISENNNNLTKDDLNYIHINKTSKLLTISFLIPAILSNNNFYNEFKLIGEKVGLLFQYVDDILDVTSSKDILGKSVGKDKNTNKLTLVSIYGLDKSKEIVEQTKNSAIDILNKLNLKTDFLQEFIIKLSTRKK